MSLPTEMKQWTTLQNGIPSLKLGTAPLPVPGKEQVLVKISAVALNYRDTEVIMGLYNHHWTASSAPPAPLVPCSDMSGTIISSHSPLWLVGDEVISIFNQTHLKGQIQAEDMLSGLGLPLQGVLAEYRVFDAEGLVRKPKYLTHVEASTLPIAGLTAWMAINGMRELGKPGGEGETVLLQGTGGVAVMGLKIAVASGMEVIITSSSDIKLAQAKKLGAHHTINYRTTPQWDITVLSLTSDKGVDIIFENGGSSTLRKSFECIAFGGLINCIGYLGGKTDAEGDKTNTNVLALKRNVTLKGLLNGPRERLEEMVAWMEERKVRPVVDRVFGFGEARVAVGYLFEGGHFGKVVVDVQGAGSGGGRV